MFTDLDYVAAELDNQPREAVQPTARWSAATASIERLRIVGPLS